MSIETGSEAAEHDIIYPAAIPFVLVHLSCLGAIWSGITWKAVAICFALYWLRIFAIGAGYHRYFSHRSYSTSRVFQFVLAFLSQSSAQNSVLWWTAKHRNHHRYSDTARDAHSALRHGFIHSHVGWIFDQQNRSVDLVEVSDLARYPELMWLHRHELVPAVTMGTACYFLAGWPGVFVGFLWSTVLVYHSTFSINSLAHMYGRPRYVTGDGSRNNWLLALFTMGEGWHNNHHAYQSSVRQGFRWWEIDATFYILRALSWIGVVWDLKTPPRQVVRNDHTLAARVVNRAAEQLAACFDAERIAHAASAALKGSQLAAQEAISTLHLPEMPSREEVLAVAKAMFAKTRSLDDIVDRAREHLIAAVHACLQARVEQPA